MTKETLNKAVEISEDITHVYELIEAVDTGDKFSFGETNDTVNSKIKHFIKAFIDELEKQLEAL